MEFKYMLMRDEDGRKKEASNIKQTTKQSNIHVHVAHPRQSLIQRKKSYTCTSGGTQTNNTLHSRQSALPVHVHVYTVYMHC